MAGEVANAETIFTAAVALSPAERLGYLTRACGDDRLLRQRVEALLRAHEAPEGFLPEQPGVSAADIPFAAGEVAAVLTEKPGDRIGGYKLLQKIGEGGCGIVYMAEQEEPVRRKVALKVIKLGMDTRQVVVRFEAERQALALMDHPNIARVLEAGATETGRPFFVMELVGGIKITDYCDQNQLTTRQRLELFIQVCHAIQHAHQKGVIHRDIKPSNILVATQDGVPVPKVIDFGIAKATQGRLTDQTVFTAFEQFLGTPAYMSPEQAQVGGVDVDTRSDIYSLGVLLYELLTGKTPFDSKDLLAAGLDAIRRTICEKEPPTPSTRVKQDLAARQVRISDQSKIKNQKSKIENDLDWIVMKCLEKDRARRYETASGLATDILRYLNQETVLAGPPSRIYRLRKLVRRNRLVFAVATLGTTALVAGAVVSVWQAVLATKAKTEALAEKMRADKEAAKQQAINRFLNEMVGSANPNELSEQDQAKGPNITMLQVVNAATRQVNSGSLNGHPEIEAAICQTLGEIYLSLFQRAAAEPLILKALELNRQIYGEQSDNTIESLSSLAHVRVNERVKLQRDVLAMERKLHGNEHPHVAASLIELADFLHWNAKGRYDVSEVDNGVENTFREGLALQRRLLPAQSPEFIQTLIGLAQYLIDAHGNMEECLSLLREALGIQTAARGAKHPLTAKILQLEAYVFCRKREYAQAQALCQKAIEIQRESLGTNHFAVSSSLDSLADILQCQNKFPEAEVAYREALAIRRQAFPDGLDFAFSLRVLADNLIAQQHFEEAELLYREALAFWQKASSGGGPGSEAYWIHLKALANILKSQNKLEDLEALYRDVLSRQRQTLGESNAAMAPVLCGLADLLVSRNQSAQAQQFYQDALEIAPKLDPQQHTEMLRSVAESLRKTRHAANLEKLYELWLTTQSQSRETPNLFFGQLLHDFGDLLARQKKFPAAAEQYLKALPHRRLALGDNLNWTLKSIGYTLYMSGKAEEAEPYMRESIKHYRALHKVDDFDGTTWPTQLLAEILHREGKLPEAEQRYREALGPYLSYNNNFPNIEHTIKLLVEVLITAKKLPEAESVLAENLKWERDKFGQQSLRTVRRLLQLAQCLKLDSKPDEAAVRHQEVVNLLAHSRAEDLFDLPPTALAELNAAGLAEHVEDFGGRILALTPTNANWLSDASWALVTAVQPGERRAALAVQLARRAVEINPQNYLARTTLGAALYRAGDWSGAASELTQAVSAYTDEDSRAGFFFLAMARLQLGDLMAANGDYAHAVSWTIEHTPADEQLLRLRAETDLLFGPDGPPQSSTP